ncbi:MAG: hypothetical protein AAFO29_16780, partial [Actinomycetota bacterium]
MTRITSVEIRDLASRTRAGSVVWRVDGRRCRTPGYLLELRDRGPVLSSVAGDGLLVLAEVR